MIYKSKVVVAKGFRIVSSVMHFTFQTAADLVLESEVKSLKMLDVYDLTAKDLKQARIERTNFKQYKLKQVCNKSLTTTIVLKDIIIRKVNKVELIKL